MMSRWSLPSLHTWILIFPIGIVLGSVCGWWAGYCKIRWDLPVGYSRKIFHFLIFTLAGIVGWIGDFASVQVFGVSIGVVVGFAVLRGAKSPFFRAIARPSDAPYERFYILMPFCMTALGGMTSNLLFGQFALIGYITTGWGDAVGEPVGTRWGKHQYSVPTLMGIQTYRSIEGSLAVFIASLIGIFLILGMGFEIPFPVVFMASLGVALVTAVVEAITFHSMDNFTIQVCSSWACLLIVNWFS